MANIKFSAFTQKVALGDVDFLVGYTGADNVRVAPSVFSGVYLPLAGGTMVGNIHFNDGINANFGGSAGAWELEMYVNVSNDAYIKKTATSAGDLTLQNASTDGDIIFSSDDGAGGTTTYMTIDGGAENIHFSKSVGVGTSVPAYNLQVESAGNAEIQSQRTGGAGVLIQSQAAVGVVGTNTNHRLDLKTNNTTYMTITPSGDVGIGLTAPSAKVDIGGMADPIVRIISDVGGDPQLRFDGSAANRSGLIKFYDNGAAAGGFIDYHHNGDKMNFGVGSISTVTMTVRDGAVGIGANINPDFNANATNLVVGSGVGSQGMTIFTGQNAGDYGSIYFADGQADGAEEYRGMITYEQNTEVMRFHTNTVEALELDVNQNAVFAGNIELGDGQQLQCGPLSGGDLKFYWDTSDGNIVNKTGHLSIINQANDKNIYLATDDGAGGTTTYIKCDGLQNYTEFPVSTRHMDNVYAQFGDSNDADIFHNGTDMYIRNHKATGDISFSADSTGSGGSATTYFALDGGEVITRFFKGANFNDNVKLTFGDVTVPGDLEIYHDTTHSYIEDTGTGNLYITGSQVSLGNGAKLGVKVVADGLVQLRFNDATKLWTKSTGIQVTGQMDITALNTAPASAGATGTLGEIRYTADYIYVCTATNTWKRTAISTW